jgi:hypothetical protein
LTSCGSYINVPFVVSPTKLRRLEQEGEMSTTAKTVILAALVLIVGYVIVWLIASTLS